MSDHDSVKRAESLLLKKRALLFQQLKTKRAKEQPPQTAIRPQKRDTQIFPASFAQQRLWFLDQLEPGNPAYSMPAAVRLSGSLDLAALQRGLSAIIERHEVLRTTFAVVDDQPVQVIGPARRVPLPLIDLQALAQTDREAQAQRLAAAEALRPFDLARGPLLRATLLQLDDEEHVVLLTSHHIVSDGWSTEVLVRELGLLYNAFASGQPAPLPELPVQYADYAAWQRAWLQGEVLESHLAYWKAQLADLSTLELPTDHPRPAVMSIQGALQGFALPRELGTRLIELGRAEEATLFMTLLAAWQVLLARSSGQDDIIVGTPIAGRTYKETHDLIGCFVNTLALRSDLSGAPTFREALRRVREVCLAAYAHQELPFEQLVEALHPARDLSRNPLFQVMFVLEHAAPTALELPSLALRPLAVEHQTTKFDLSLTLVEAGSEVGGTLEYNTSLFEAATITRLLEHFQRLLEGIVARPDLRIADMPLLTEAERQQLLVAWNATAADYPRDRCLHHLFEAQVARAPDVIAVVFDRPTTNDQRPTTTDHRSPLHPFTLSPLHSFIGHHLTYYELNRRANQLARFLQHLGVGPETRVGICLERSPELAVGLLGVLKAGGACLPLDPDFPAERLAFMLEDAQARVLITTNDQRPTTNDYPFTPSPLHPFTVSPPHLVTLSQGAVVYLDADWPAIVGACAENLCGSVRPANAAYAIYTSGSTGRPKGVLIPHQALVNYTLAAATQFGLRAGDRMLQFASLSFDVVIEELFPAWSCGAAVVLSGAGLLAPAQEFGQLLARAGVTALELPAAYWHAWVDELTRSDQQLPAALRLVLLGCEKPSPSRLAAWSRFGTPLIYVFGLTETAITSTVYAYAAVAGDAPALPELPIGRPVANTQVYVLDGRMQPVPVGVVGELYIGGDGLARGYLNRPDLTAERFVPNPFAGVTGDGCWVLEDSAPNTQHPTPNTRLYRTGDLARYRADGNLEFLGRRDDQVKLRGYRVELGEVATALRQHASVREAVAMVREDAPGDRRLVAYVVTSDKSQVTSEGGNELATRHSLLVTELRDFLKNRLPDYMVPSTFVVLDALPLTPSGKLDRRALPAPDHSRSSADESFIAPRTPVEELLAQIWADVLRLERVGAGDDFFVLGGHSLLATQLIARVRAAFQVELPLRHLFEAPTVAELAARITTARHDGLGPSAPPLRPVPRDRALSVGSGQGLPLSFAQQRLWFFDQLQPHSSAYNISAAVRLTGAFDAPALWRTLSAIICRHESLRTTFAAVDGLPVQRIWAAHPAPLALLDLRALPEREQAEEARRLAMAEALQPFDLSSGPLLRVTLLWLAAQEHVALLTMHHIIADAWSMEILIREIATLYPAFAAGRPAQLPELPIQYADYAAWQRAWLNGEVLEAHLAYWRRQLADLPALNLPTDYPRPLAESFHGTHHDFVLPQPLHDGLAALSRAEGVTLFMTLLAGWQALLSRYSGQDDIAIGTPIANRGRAETENLIGFFLNTLVLRTDLDGAPAFRALLRRVREVCLDAYAHQDLPFEQVVEALAPTRDLSRHPLFQIMFTLEHAPAVELTLPELALRPLELALRPLEVAHGTVHFDLSLSLEAIGSNLIGTLRYRTDLFEAATIERMLGHLQALLAGVLADPERRLADLPILTDAEQQQLLVEWNATQAPYPDDRCIHQLFEAQAARTPDAVAVIFDGRPTTNDQRPTTNDQRPRIASFPSSVLSPQSSVLSPQSLTYAELNARANQLGHYLRALGVAPEVPVATCLERSIPLVVALLGIFKAGGTYLPLSPRYPAERLAFMLNDAQAAVLLTQKSIYDLRFTIYDLEESGSAIVNRKSKIVNLDAEWAVIAAAPGHNLGVTAAPTELAYLIYTSGTTGRPKAVMVEHCGLVNTLCASQARYQFGAQDRLPALLSFAFDISLFQVFSPLLVGGTLVLIAEEQVLDIPRLAELVRDLTFFHSTPSLLRQIVDFIQAADQPAAYTRVRQVAVGGDVIPPTLIEDLRRAFPAAQLYVGYGPTEATIMSTNYAVTDAAPRSHLIGRPLQNMQVQLYDRHQQLVPIGVAGEIYIGGASVARGYLRRPELTAEKFVPNPFAGVLGDRCWVLEDSTPNTQHPSPNTRLYRTGDLARWRSEGVLEFLGRIDDQVKVRGFRIELGEVEAVLGAHPAVRTCVVVARADGAGEVRLVAYVVPTNDQRLTTNDQRVSPSDSSSVLSPQSSVLRTFLAERLPDYMVPAAFVLLDALPLTAHGKVDRRALPAPEPRDAPPDESFVAPRTPVEELLAQIWADVLRLPRVGVDDNFFALGGHSLLATQVAARVREAFAIELPLRSLFEAPTVAGLAARIVSIRQDVPGPQAPLAPVPRTGPLPLSFAQQRLWFIDRLQPNTSAYNMPTAVRLTGRLDLAAMARSLRAIVERHEVLRTTFETLDGQPVQVIAPVALVALPLIDLQALPEQEREATARQLAGVESRRSFDLARGPVIRAALLRLGAQEYVVLLTLHHIVCDGWSISILIRELAACYAAHAAGQVAPLPPLPIQYADYAVWQREWLEGSGVRGLGSGVRGQGATAPVPPPAGGGTEGGRSQESDVGASQIQNSKLKTQNSPLQAQLAYWKAQLAGLAVLELPTDHPRPAVQTFSGASQGFVLPAELSAQLRALSRREGTTLFMTLLAAWQTLLSRYSGQDDIVVGSPIAGRTHKETEGLIGCFLNTLVLRADMSGDLSFREALRRVREVCLDAYAHQDLPFEQIVDALQPARDLSRNPLFQVLFALQNAPAPDPELPSLALRPLGVEHGTTQFDLLLSMEEAGAELAGMLDYRTDLFAAATIARMLGHFQTLLEGIVAEPAQRLADLPLLTESERRQLLIEWNATSATYPHDQCLHQLFETQVARTPDAVAVIFDQRPTTNDQRPTTNDQRPRIASFPSSVLSPQSSVLSPQSLTYDELNRRANQCAHYLQQIGVGPDIRVAICMERSPSLVIGLLGILKAGGAYVPLDPTHPRERLAFLLDDAQAPVLVTQDRLVDNLPTSWAYVVPLDGEWDRIAQQPADDPISGARPGHLAYVIYTSGSTGQPKGVLIPHQGLVNYLSWCVRAYAVAEGRGAPVHSPLGFDLTVTSLFAPLLAGQPIMLLPEDAGLTVLSAALRGGDGFSLVKVTPTHLELLNQMVPGPALAGRARALIIGGEALWGESLAFWRIHAPGTRLINEYGPTETVVGCCVYEVPAGARPAGAVPIGRPIANTQLYLLDRSFQPVPIGAPGELYIGGVGLARGYHNRPDLTAAAFIPNPFGGVLGDGCWVLEDSAPDTQHPSPNTRLYRTGDRARYRPDGVIEFLGRTDHQIKVRGYRIELGEIEALLAQHPAVREAVVLAREDVPGDKRLVAYVVPKIEDRGLKIEDSGSSAPAPLSSILYPLSSELRGFLQERLPDYMVPADFVLLDALPLTPNGKVDRGALPAPDTVRAAPGDSYAAPRTPVEAALASIYAEVLRLERVGIHDNFFSLGGHSLLATQIILRVRVVLQVELPLQSIFETPTVAGLAEYIEVVRRAAQGLQAPFDFTAEDDEGEV